MTWINTRDDLVTPRRCPAVRALILTPVLAGMLAIGVPCATVMAQRPTPQDLYLAAQAAERDARAAMTQSSAHSDAPLSLVRAAVRSYRNVVLRFPTSGYCDDALWYAGRLGADAFARFGLEHDRQSAIAQFSALASEYPASPFVPRVKPALAHLAAAQASPDAGAIPAPARPAVALALQPAAPTAAAPVASAAATPPTAPAANSRGGYSIARQLGMRVGRVVIDPGHGGSDPGAIGADVSEAAVTLDVALKLEALLTQATGVEVVLTRRTDQHVGLQERTAIANREGADLFVSIHVNANRDRTIQGIETFLLNFASTPRAAAVAARENAGSTETMSQLDNVVKQIALNSKIDESRELATQLQTAMVRRLRSADKGLRDLGVKQAPFVVLIGARMPSVLVEMAFLTNPNESQLLATTAFRQRLAEALSDGVTRYLRSLKKTEGVVGPQAAKAAAKIR